MSTPPPQGQNPFAQGQQPYGQQPQGGAPYGQAPGAPYPPQPGAPQQPGVPLYQGGPDSVTPPKKSKKKFIFIGAAVAIVVAIGAAVLAGQDEAAAAEVGDCMSVGNPTSSTDPDLKIVDCGDSKAAYKVAEKKDSGTCDLTKYSQYRETGRGDDFTLCLEKLKK
ncbi:hypothetical protein GCM10010252_20550 [Streptomyces aureoverticillatus]|nr:hypothetical protein GCM10010252_20550 [Streptomyces aureoverticillatus]